MLTSKSCFILANIFIKSCHWCQVYIEVKEDNCGTFKKGRSETSPVFLVSLFCLVTPPTSQSEIIGRSPGLTGYHRLLTQQLC